MAKVTPFLWFDGKAEEAANFYVSLFDSAKILDVSRSSDESSGATGSAISVSFELEGQKFIALNGGPQFTFTPAISFFIDCTTQAEVDSLWDRLSEGGEPGQCGWVRDKYGLSWQIVPSVLPELMQSDNDQKSEAVMQAMLTMTKLDIEALQRAYDRA